MTALVLYLVMARQHGSAIGVLGLLLLGINMFMSFIVAWGDRKSQSHFYGHQSLAGNLFANQETNLGVLLGLVWLLPPSPR